jgi:hypothetical protein
MAGITNYTTLSTEIQNWLHRADLASEIDTFIQITENQLNRELRCKQMDVIAVINTTGNTLPLPSDYQQARNVEIAGSPVTPLRYVTPEQRDLFDLQSSTGKPRLYSIKGGNLVLAPTPDQVYQVNFEYYQQLPTIVGGANATNWLLTAHPDCYLYGCLLASNAFVLDPRAQQWQSLFEKTKADINRIDDDSTYAGSVIRVRPDAGF